MKFELPPIITEIKNHSREVRTEAENIKKQVLNGLLTDESPKRELLEGITIDKITSKDLDDGIWAEKTKSGYSIFVSIADVAEIIKPGSLIDIDALIRSTSVYTKNHTFHMIPDDISTDLCSLNDQTTRLTVTTRIDINNDFKIIGSEIFESKFKNKKRFDYGEFNKQFNNYGSEYFKDLNLFHKIAKGLYGNRMGDGANPDFREHVALKIGKEGAGNNSTASFIIQEFMILANIENAKINYKEKINGIFRLHMPDLQGKIASTPTIQRAFYNYRHGYHYGLGESFYGHFTSPIRRYSDLINHRQQKAKLRHLKNKTLPKEIYNINEIRKIIIHINSTIEETLRLGKDHNKEVTEKRIERFLKRLSENNYDNISSIGEDKFSKMIKYFIIHPEYFENKNIYSEILYRTENDLLLEKSISRLISAPNELGILNPIKDIIREKKIVTEIY